MFEFWNEVETNHFIRSGCFRTIAREKLEKLGLSRITRSGLEYYPHEDTGMRFLADPAHYGCPCASVILLHGRS